MIDIIIPAYDAHSTIVKTLANLRTQINIQNAIIYIIDDCSNRGYEYEASLFKDELNIVLLKTTKNIGPGAARQFGIQNSSGKYIIFMDADDQFYTPYSMNLLYNEIKNTKTNIVSSKQYIRNYGVDEINKGSLHGKIYRRSFIEKNKLKFNNTRYSEDNSFNCIATHITKNIRFLNHISYLYFKKSEPLGMSDEDKEENLILYSYNIIWIVLELQKRKLKKCDIAKIFLYYYLFLYRQVYINCNKDFSNLYIKCYRLEQLYSKYEKYVTLDMLYTNLSTIFNCESIYFDPIKKDFDNFRIRFNGGKK